MRLIDADALIDNIPQADLNNDKKISKCGAIADMVLLVCDAPTIDAVPVVRCKECEYYNITCCSSGTGWCETVGKRGRGRKQHHMARRRVTRRKKWHYVNTE